MTYRSTILHGTTILDAEGPCHCANCDWRGEAENLNPIEDIGTRLTAGCIVPAGECPACGALAYLDKRPGEKK